MFILGQLIPLFWTSGDVTSGFQSQSGHLWFNTLQVHLASVAASCYPHIRVSADVGRGTRTG